ncbi:MAG: hypothetical protein ISS25_03665 [Nanoarchaeota archaeon]|nr:hypothetical protein [DPANN group archaeon]MBL7116900.1 hypothetical protein [Nanoarchaeota archaeon]
MGKIEDLDITGLISEKSGAPLGDAHELLVRAVLMRLGFEVGKVDLSSGPYDLIVGAFEKPKGKRLFLKVQIKTISSNSLTLKGGSRGGIDRTYKSGVKTYKYSKKDTDVILGVDKKNFDFYIFPTLFTSKYGGSVSKSKILVCKNNWAILLNWNSKFLSRIKKALKT